jgi:DNA-binding NarL/FixJ family response regulator
VVLVEASIEVVASERLEPGELRVLDEGTACPDLRHIVIVSVASRRQTTELLTAGVQGIIVATTLERALVPTIEAVLAGQLVVPGSVRDAVRRPLLSPREKQILGMVVMGFTNQEIAARLHLATSTVKSHLGTMFAELGVSSRKEAADLVFDPSAALGPGIIRITPEEGE